MRTVVPLLFSLVMWSCEVATSVAQLPDAGAGADAAAASSPQDGGGREPACSPARCPDGCCQGDRCVALTTQDIGHCGKGGEQCVSCPGAFAAVCANGVCGLSLCGACEGCCLGPTCSDGKSQKACGRQGEFCIPCFSGQRCVEGRCVD